MQFSLLPIFVFLTVGVVASNAALPPELYWNSRLPTTPMVKFITDLLHTSDGNWREDKSAAMSKGLFNYHQYSDASETQLRNDPNVAVYFLEKDLKPGHKMNLHFTQPSSHASFLPRHIAKSIPFSSDKVDDILKQFSVEPESEDAEVMKTTIKECEEPVMKGEEKHCATSLEAMVDFTTSNLGNNVKALSTETDNESEAQEYTIAPGVKKVEDQNVVACHKQKYPYVVFYCHATVATRVYTVPLQGANGSRVKAVAICHTDTSQWNPKHLAFLLLNVKPGSVSVCHFLPQDHVAWVPTNNN